ncbi:hypothetical protein GLOIN_2v1764356 [Rhizophagus irregularis DAOM 181602=DAOM 197198]|nr:hypothetical protein GLOIN_2v1764356 [Rhizophagus irregularis DAOM 181602=DAOM 197198]
MACSKFFSGDLSELLNEVIQYFHYDYKTLHSCILVNRLWCRLAIPLLWQDPFSIKSPKNYRFIEIYLCNLSDDDKKRLNEYVIHSGLFPSNTLFNYPKFIKHLDIYKVYNSIETWAYTNLPTSPTTQIFGVIIKNYEEFECFDAAFELILQNTNFVYNIKSLTLDFDDPNCSNTLNTIIFYSIDFKNINVLSELFNQLNVLESIHIVNCYSLDSGFIQQINNITKPFKLRTLFLDKMDELLDPLIQKSGNYLENFKRTKCNSLQLSQSLELYCSNIKFLYVVLHFKNINLIFKLIKNIRQNLNYLIINSSIICNVDGKIKFSSILLQNLGQILPFKLEYLNLVLAIKGSDLEVFLKNSQNTYIKKLLIRNAKYDKNNQDILPYIKEYIMKKKRVEYLAILDLFRGKGVDLFSLKDEVKEFQLYDIQVLDYYDSVIGVYDFIKETY